MGYFCGRSWGPARLLTAVRIVNAEWKDLVSLRHKSSRQARQRKCYFLKTILFLGRVSYKYLLLNSASFNSNGDFSMRLKAYSKNSFKGCNPQIPTLGPLLQDFTGASRSYTSVNFPLDLSLGVQLIILGYGIFSYQILAPPLFRFRRRPCRNCLHNWHHQLVKPIFNKF